MREAVAELLEVDSLAEGDLDRAINRAINGGKISNFDQPDPQESAEEYSIEEEEVTE